MKKLKNLTNFQIRLYKISNALKRKIIKCLKNSSDTLQIFKFLEKFKVENDFETRQTFFEYFLANLTALEEMNIDDFEDPFNCVYLTSILKLLNNCKLSLKKIELKERKFTKSSFLFNNLETILSNISNLTNLKELNIDYSFLQVNTCLVDVIKIHQNSLTNLTIINRDSNCDLKICDAISNCYNLKDLKGTFNVAGFKRIFTDLFYQHNSLENLKIFGCWRNEINVNEYILEFLSKLKLLREIQLADFQIPHASFEKFSSEMNKLNLNIESLGKVRMYTENEVYGNFYQNTFYFENILYSDE